jgi:hypothetical protein
MRNVKEICADVVQSFRHGKTDADDNQQAGCPLRMTIWVRNITLNIADALNWHTARQLYISLGAVHGVVHDQLDYRKVRARCVL